MTGKEEYSILKDYIKEHARSYKESGDKIVFSCLFHDDATPSASMKIGRSGRPIIYCSVCGKIYDKIRRDAGLWREPCNDRFSPFEKFLHLCDEYILNYEISEEQTGESKAAQFAKDYSRSQQT